jgi:hypothetical protein
VTPHYNEITFANNDVDFTDSTGIDHASFSYGLKKSLFNYMHGIGFEMPLQDWFDFTIPASTIDPYYIEDCLNTEANLSIKPTAKIVWIGTTPIVSYFSKKKRQLATLLFHTTSDAFAITLSEKEARWIIAILPSLSPQSEQLMTFSKLKSSYEEQFEHFELFWFSKPLETLKEKGLLVL